MVVVAAVVAAAIIIALVVALLLLTPSFSAYGGTTEEEEEEEEQEQDDEERNSRMILPPSHLILTTLLHNSGVFDSMKTVINENRDTGATTIVLIADAAEARQAELFEEDLLSDLGRMHGNYELLLYEYSRAGELVVVFTQLPPQSPQPPQPQQVQGEDLVL
jgi:hypothetical protein